MRISVWQQFSSNHSGHFWVAGTFKTIADAETAYYELRRILQKIDQWHRDNSEESEDAKRSGKIMPPEIEIAQQYNIVWPTTIDWDNWANYELENLPAYASYDARRNSERLIDEAVTLIGNIVTVQNPDQTWMTVHPFQDLLERLGATTVGFDMDFIESEAGRDFDLRFELIFSAPDDTRANRVDSEIRAYLERPFTVSDNIPPWNDDASNFEKAFARGSILNPDAVKHLVDDWQSRYDSYTKRSDAESIPAFIEMPTQRLTMKGYDKYQRDGLKFIFENLWFANMELGLAAFIAYLEVHGCTNIELRYTQIKREDKT